VNRGVNNVVETEATVAAKGKWYEGLFGTGMKDLKSGTAWAKFFGRLGLGFLFLWSGYQKTLAWANGGMATKGFLSGASVAGSPLAGFFNSLSGNWTVEYLVVFGELAVGISLIFGFFTRIGCISGMLQMTLFTAAMWPIADKAGDNPLVDIRVIYGLMLLMFFFTTPGRFLGVDGIIEKYLPQRFSKLKWLLG